MADLIAQLEEVKVLVREKHQAGRHDQSSHTPKKYGKGSAGKPGEGTRALAAAGVKPASPEMAQRAADKLTHLRNVGDVKRVFKLRKNPDGSFSTKAGSVHYPEDATPGMRKLGFEQTYEGSETGMWQKGNTIVDFEVYMRDRNIGRSTVPQMLSSKHPGKFRFYTVDEAEGRS